MNARFLPFLGSNLVETRVFQTKKIVRKFLCIPTFLNEYCIHVYSAVTMVQFCSPTFFITLPFFEHKKLAFLLHKNDRLMLVRDFQGSIFHSKLQQTSKIASKYRTPSVSTPYRLVHPLLREQPNSAPSRLVRPYEKQLCLNQTFSN